MQVPVEDFFWGGYGINIIDGAKIKNNTAHKNGGGLYIESYSDLPDVEIKGATEITGNKALQEGGGIYTTFFTDYSSLTGDDYQNFTTADTVVFRNNTASAAYEPPEIAVSYENIKYKRTSILSINGEYIHPMNNYDINYVGETRLVVYKLSYDTNNGIGTVPESMTVEGGITLQVASKGNLQRKGYTFIGWNTQLNGGGTEYAAGSTITVSEDTVLYAQWGKEDSSGDGGGNGGNGGNGGSGGNGQGGKTSDNNTTLPWIVLIAVAGLGTAAGVRQLWKVKNN